jgi:hypothetical protein
MVHPAEAENFHRALAAAGQVLVAMEASGHARWFARLLRKLQFECTGDAAEIQSKRGCEQASSFRKISRSQIPRRTPCGRTRPDRADAFAIGR